MKITIILIFTLLVSSLVGNAQNGSFTGMANSSVMLYDFWAIQNNQAGLADLKTIEIGINYDYNYSLWQTGVQSFGFVLPTKSGVFNFTANRYGYSGYSENITGFGYSRNLGRYFSASLQFDYLFYHQAQNYGLRGAFLFEAGMISRPVENLQIGVHIFNPSRVKLEDYNDEQIRTVFRFGISYKFIDNLLVSVETEKELEEENRFKTGFEYEVIKQFFIRTGFLTNPNQFTLGIGYSYSGFYVDIAMATHETLPLSSQISFRYRFK